MVDQTLRPRLWVCVDDGSSDSTGALVRRAAAQHDWIRVVRRSDRGFRKSGSGVIEAFNDGLRAIGGLPWDYLVKFDGDLSFVPSFFASCFERFAAEPKLGIG